MDGGGWSLWCLDGDTAPGDRTGTGEDPVQQNAAAWLFEIALALRVFGPDVVRGCRRMLTAGVRIGITGLTGTRALSRSTESTRDVP